jgi:hypothetical protein
MAKTVVGKLLAVTLLLGVGTGLCWGGSDDLSDTKEASNAKGYGRPV